jgi:carbon storage regulator
MRRDTQLCRFAWFVQRAKGVRIMLVLSRKVSEEIIVDGDTRIKVVDVAGNRIGLGISAPAEVTINRSEICCQTDETRPDADDRRRNGRMSLW